MATPKKINIPLTVGNNVFIRTVTNYYTGQVVGLLETEVILVDAAWVASTGRFSEALKTGILDEVEPYPDGEPVQVNRSAVVDVCNWRHKLPREVK